MTPKRGSVIVDHITSDYTTDFILSENRTVYIFDPKAKITIQIIESEIEMTTFENNPKSMSLIKAAIFSILFINWLSPFFLISSIVTILDSFIPVS